MADRTTRDACLHESADRRVQNIHDPPDRALPAALRAQRSPRTAQCGFMGTTNKMRYLRDETGNRRSWPLAVGEIDIESLERDRDQLWGDAVQLFRKGVHWWPDYTFELEHIRPQQHARFEPDPWEPLIKKYLAPRLTQYLAQRPSITPPKVTML